MTTTFYLGANSRRGFENLFDSFLDRDDLTDVMVLKGGPGVGKSTFMKFIGQKAEVAGEDVEYIRCSGDPDSLDAVFLPRLGIVALDGTPPHVVEPKHPVAVERIVDLGRFYDVEMCKERREMILERTARYQAEYRRAYRALRAAGEAEDALRGIYTAGYRPEKAQRRFHNILRRELKKHGTGTGLVTKRYLGGLTAKGEIYRFDTLETLTDRVYVLLDAWGVGESLLQQAVREAVLHSFDVIACPDSSGRLAHVLIPELRLGFVTDREGMHYPGKAYRRIHLDAMLDRTAAEQYRGRCRFYKKVKKLLEEEALEALQSAKAGHDLLEEAYHDTVDFDGVQQTAEAEWQRIAKKLS